MCNVNVTLATESSALARAAVLPSGTVESVGIFISRILMTEESGKQNIV